MTSKHTQTPHIASMRESFFKQGLLDEEFLQLEQVEDALNPDFVEEIYTVFFRHSVRYLNNIERELETYGNGRLNFNALNIHMYHFKDSSSSVGAAKVTEQAILFRRCCDNENAEGVKMAFEQLKKEFAILKEKIEIFFQLIRQATPTETADRPK